MGHSAATSSQAAEISVIPDLEQNSEKKEDVERVIEIGETITPKEQHQQEDNESTTKKSLSFKLAFIGLAASLFVFQLDATCLGIALPVSPHTFLIYLLHKYSSPMLDHCWGPKGHEFRVILGESGLHSLRSSNAASLGEHLQRIRPETPSLRVHGIILRRFHRLCHSAEYEHHHCWPGPTRSRWWRN